METLLVLLFTLHNFTVTLGGSGGSGEAEFSRDLLGIFKQSLSQSVSPSVRSVSQQFSPSVWRRIFLSDSALLVSFHQNFLVRILSRVNLWKLARKSLSVLARLGAGSLVKNSILSIAWPYLVILRLWYCTWGHFDTALKGKAGRSKTKRDFYCVWGCLFGLGN